MSHVGGFVVDTRAKTQPKGWCLTSYEEDPDWIAEFNAVVADESVPEEEGTYDHGDHIATQY